MTNIPLKQSTRKSKVKKWFDDRVNFVQDFNCFSLQFSVDYDKTYGDRTWEVSISLAFWSLYLEF